MARAFPCTRRMKRWQLIAAFLFLNCSLFLWISSGASTHLVNTFLGRNEALGTLSAVEGSSGTDYSQPKISTTTGLPRPPMAPKPQALSIGSRPSTEKAAPNCPDILAGMTSGHWLKRNLTSQEQMEIDIYLRSERGAFRIPASLQRLDGRCGNVSYVGSPLYPHMWFKAICNPKGTTPCCQNNRCVSASVDQCQCPTCYDERPAVHAEYAKWQPEIAACQANKYSTNDACELLRGSTIAFIGDSFVRHVFVAMVILLTGNTKDGALKSNISPGLRHTCSGWYQITGLSCRALLVEKRSLCNGTVQVEYQEVFPSKQMPSALPILKSTIQTKKSLTVFGLGIHDDFKADTVTSVFLNPFLNIHRWLQRHPSGDIETVVSAVKSFTTDIAADKKAVQKSSSSSSSSSSSKSSSSNRVQFTYDRNVIAKEVSRLNASLSPTSTRPDTELELSWSPRHASSQPSASPELLWLGIHAPGVLKSPKFSRQTHTGVMSFNRAIYEELDAWHVPHLDTYSFTNGVVSHDGTHYGWGINMLKVDMILTYVQERLKQGKWRDST